jgi:hypothetical protein
MTNDFFVSKFGNNRRFTFRSSHFSWLTDRLFDLVTRMRGGDRVDDLAAKGPVRRILITSVVVPGREAELDSVIAALKKTRHQITVALTPLGNRGKFQNINLALKDIDVGQFDWLVVFDDDVALSDNFMDRFIWLCEATDLKMAMPAHKFNSFVGYILTYRKLGSLVRQTNYVECGPVTAFHRDFLPMIYPFADVKWAWGMDVAWAEQALRAGFAIGIVDATPLRHLKPIAATYDGTNAAREGTAYLDSLGIDRPKSDFLRTVRVVPVDLDPARTS